MRQFHYICEAPLARETESLVDDASPASVSESSADVSTTTTGTPEVVSVNHGLDLQNQQINTEDDGENDQNADALSSNGNSADDEEKYETERQPFVVQEEAPFE